MLYFYVLGAVALLIILISIFKFLWRVEIFFAKLSLAWQIISWLVLIVAFVIAVWYIYFNWVVALGYNFFFDIPLKKEHL